jgi:hypothetical protein
VGYVSVSPETSRDLRSLELTGLVLRLPADFFRRRKGFTTVMLNPHVIGTTDVKLIELWNRANPVGNVRSDHTAQ